MVPNNIGLTFILIGMFCFESEAQIQTPLVNPPFDQANNIRAYLNRVAGSITNEALSDVASLSEWQSQRNQRVRELIEMLGLQDHQVNGIRTPPKVIKTGSIQQAGFRIEKLYYESLPNLYVAANLYIPNQIDAAVPAILYVCGHSHSQKHHYQAHARSFAENGFVCLIIETIQRGEVKGEHLGAESLGWFHWYSRGYNPGGVEVWNGIRAIDLLCHLPEVDTSKIGVTGISGGGSQSWYLPALDPRIKGAAAVDGAASIEGQVCQRTIDDHCDCMMPINTYNIDFSDIGALIAPRPFMIAQTTDDGYYSIEAVQTLYDRISPLYRQYGKPQNLQMIKAPGGHGYGNNEEFRYYILAFFLRELMGVKITHDQIPKIDISQELSEEELRVYVDGVPPNDMTTTIQDHFVRLADAPDLQSSRDLDIYRKNVVDFLKRKTFRAFPAEASPLDLRLDFRDGDFAKYGRNNYSFVSEPGWRLNFSLRRRQPADQNTPLILVLVNPDAERYQHYALSSGISDRFNLAYLETRGVGETGWSPSLQWHIRRAAAWTGRTIASMRVYDVLRCLDVLTKLPGIDSQQIFLAAEGEMVAVASYAALLHGNIAGLIMKNPPPTQNESSQPSGRGEAIEMLNCLQVTDLPQVTGLMFPKKIIAIGEIPDTYSWVGELYTKLNRLEQFVKVESLSDWQSDH